MASPSVSSANRESWWTHAVNSITSLSHTSRTPAPQQNRQAAQPHRVDRVAVSADARPGRTSLRQEAVSRVTGWLGDLRHAVTHPSETVERLGQGGSRLLQGAADFIGRRADDTVSGIGRAQGAMTRVGTRLVASGLEGVGSPQAAERLRRTGEVAARTVESVSGQAGEMTSNFVSGIGDGAGGLVEGLGTAAAHPLQTAQAIQRLDQVVNPVSQLRAAVIEGKGLTGVMQENFQTVSGIVEGVREEYRETGRDHGGAGQIGRAAFDIVTTVATGGSGSAGRVGLRSTANLLDDFGRASRAAAAGEEIAGVGRFTRAAGEFVGNRLSGPLAPVAERVTAAAESGSAALVRRADRIHAENIARGEQRAQQAGAVPGADGAEILGSARGRANSLSGQVRETQRLFDAGGAERQALVDQLPAPLQQRVRDLEAAGNVEQAVDVIKRHQVDEAIRASLDEVGQVDQLYPSQVPDNVDPSRVLARGRRESLEFLLQDSSLGSEGVRRNFRHIVGDSDVTGPVFIQEFKQGDRVGRAFSSSAGRETGIGSGSGLRGNYYGSVEDANLSRRQIQVRNAVGLDNHADMFASLSLPEDTYGVVSRIGEQFQMYGEHALGGNMQYTFPGLVQPTNAVIGRVGRISANAQATLDAILGTSLLGRQGDQD